MGKILQERPTENDVLLADYPTYFCILNTMRALESVGNQNFFNYLQYYSNRLRNKSDMLIISITLQDNENERQNMLSNTKQCCKIKN